MASELDLHYLPTTLQTKMVLYSTTYSSQRERERERERERGREREREMLHYYDAISVRSVNKRLRALQEHQKTKNKKKQKKNKLLFPFELSMSH